MECSHLHEAGLAVPPAATLLLQSAYFALFKERTTKDFLLGSIGPIEIVIHSAN